MKQQFVFELSMVAATIVIFLFMLLLNEFIFVNSEFIRGVNWIYLPAGARLLCTLLFGGAGAIGILIASWLSCVYYFFPDDFIRSVVGTLISAGAPYMIYLFARRHFGLKRSLSNLTAKPLIICVVAFALANSGLHHLWTWLQGQPVNINSLLVMFIGDINGCVLMLYGMKLVLHLITPKKAG